MAMIRADVILPGTLLRGPVSLRTVIERSELPDLAGNTMVHLRSMLADELAKLAVADERMRMNCTVVWSDA